MNETLLNKLKENNLIEGDMINLDNRQYVDIPTFTTFFGNSLIYDELIGQHTFTWNGEQLTRTGIELGYKPFFDKWKELGIL